MQRRGLTLLLVLSCLPAWADSSTDLAAIFVSVLRQDTLPSLVAHAVPELELAVDEWIDLRDMIEKYDCIDARAIGTKVEARSDDKVTLRIELAGTGETAGGVKRTKVLPRFWIVDFVRRDGRWKMQTARTLEHIVAVAIRNAADEDGRWSSLRCELDRLDLDELALIAAYRISPKTANMPFVLHLARATGNKTTEAIAFRYATAESIPDLVLAAEHSRASERAARESGEADALAAAEFSRAVVHLFSGDLEQAAASYRGAASYIDQMEDARLALKAEHMAGHMEIARGNLIAAARHSERTAINSRKYGWTEGEIVSTMRLARVQSDLGDQEALIRTELELARRAESIGRRQLAGISLFNAGVTMLEQGDEAEGIRLLERSATLSDMAAGALPGALGIHRFLHGDYEEADRFFKETVKITRAGNNRPDESGAIAMLSRIASKRGRFDEALTYARDALRILDEKYFPQGSSPFAPWDLHVVEGIALAGLRRVDDATRSYERAIELIEAQKSTIAPGQGAVGFLDQKTEAFLDLIRLRSAQGRAIAALTVSERLKARMLHDLLEHGQVDLRAVMSAEERAEDERLNQRMVELNRAVSAAGDRVSDELQAQLDRTRFELQAFTVRTQLTHPELRRLPPRITTEDDVRRWLDEKRIVPSRDALVLDYVVDKEETILFAIEQDASGRANLSTVTLPIPKEKLEQGVRRLLTRIEQRNLGYSESAEELYGQLIAPIAKLLRGKTKICIIPHGSLWHLPFAVLRGPDGKHLVERFAIHYSPSLAYLDLASDESPSWLPDNPRLLALGNPTIGSESRARVRALTRATLGSLPEAATEARTIGRLYRSDRVDVLLEAAASEEAVKATAAQTDILHFATHGISNAGQPLYSSLVLAAQTEREDGLLEAREILRMNLPTSLVVLSACDTARGGIAEGEGVIGLSWAFLVAGCPRTVVTQWRADSAAAARAMIRFHRHIANEPGGGSVSAALRVAQLDLLRSSRYSHPYYWGGFVVVGAGW